MANKAKIDLVKGWANDENGRAKRLIKEAFECRIRDLNNKIKKCVGSLYPNIMGNEINDLCLIFAEMFGENLDPSLS